MKNCRIWRTVSSDGAALADGKWRWMLFDTEYSCGIYGYEKTSPGYDHLKAMQKSGRYPLFSRVMERREFRKRLADSLEKVKGSMTEKRFDDECAKWINNNDQRDLLKKNRLRFGYPADESFDDSQPSSELSRMKSFIRERPNTIDRLIMELSKSDI